MKEDSNQKTQETQEEMIFHPEIKRLNKAKIILYTIPVLVIFGVFFGVPHIFSTKYISGGTIPIISGEKEEGKDENKFVPIYLPTPNSVKGVYMTSWVAGTDSLRKQIVKLVEDTELNTIIIDIKDDTGRVSFAVEDEYLNEIGSPEVRIPDIKEFIKYLNTKGIYIIGRISVFQDPYLIKQRPDLAVKRASDGAVWRDRKGIGWLDAGSHEAWDYVVSIARESYNVGFDELNFDYIRFPSDGNMRDIYYPFSEEKVLTDPDFGKAKVLKNFFAYLDSQLEDLDMPISADLFGMTTTNKDDLNIGQVLENALPYFDYIAPMVYPSHYPTGFNGYQNVNAYPYEIVNFSMSEAVKRIREFKEIKASTTPNAPYLSKLRTNQLRPWLQDNDYPVPYTPEMVRAQIDATYDAGLNSWMLWDAANTYTRAALENVTLENQE
ncbi:MAG TPA: putative glycoside hydrolase [Candidatus Paceibacterota bacterium]|jgi:hypothetical protein|nr:hypothetical protein [Parcubacteria group bacterium]MDP6119757.1 putative glycoside hydrolase [Candidatus Paceibacterota bacterium]HJN62931.1 putative glycoside hydrolase [Candidatus Paceibacterota bacterium]|tara:strand:- start:299 stop:1609 length:1311 start_codon:yes stop_codon:yes gene_type:complete